MSNLAVATALLAGPGLASLAQQVPTERFCRGSQEHDKGPCWLQWSGWSQCTGVCQQGMKTQKRGCRGGIPGLECKGSDIKRRACPAVARSGSDKCPYWSFWSDWTPYPGCDCPVSSDPCILITTGTRQRRRKCEDPTSVITGEQPNCSGLDAQVVPWSRDQPIWTQSCVDTTIQPPVISPAYGAWVWGECEGATRLNGYCGIRRGYRQHVCKDVAGTWVEESKFTEHSQHPDRCCTARCDELEVSVEILEHSEFPECYNRNKLTRKRFESFSKGCEAHIDFGRMKVVSVTTTYTLYEIVEIETIPVSPPPAGDHRRTPGTWTGCTPQPRPIGWPIGPSTTCHANGIKTRTNVDICAHVCGGAPDCLWNMPPYTIHETENCGPQGEPVRRNNCLTNRCDPTCTTTRVCDGIDIPGTTTTIQCGSNECNIPVAPWIEPAKCGCRGDQKFRTRNPECSAPEKEFAGTCPPQLRSCKERITIESQLMIEARNNGKCICKVWEQYYDESYEQCTYYAENQEVCKERKENQQRKASKYASDQCPGPEVCEACPTTCRMPGQAAFVAQCHQQDLCTTSSIKTRTIQCEQEICCTWSEWQVEVPCSNFARCPSAAVPEGREVRRYIDATGNLCPVEGLTIKNIEYRPVYCPSVPCPQWPDFGAWSLCSQILEDGTVCGGFRSRGRDYPCREDVANGKCLPNNGYLQNQGQIYDPYTQIEQLIEASSSEYCLGLYRAPENFARTIEYLEWSEWARVTDQTACSGTDKAKESRTRLVRNRCTGDIVGSGDRYEGEERWAVITPCREDPSTERCTLEAGACQATIEWDCVAQDPCGRSMVLTREASVAELKGKCGLKKIIDYTSDSPCRSTGAELVVPSKQCLGICDRVTTYKCPHIFAELREQPACFLPETCGPWSSWVPENGIAIVNGIEFQGEYTDDYGQVIRESIMCDACGGPVTRTRTCVSPNTRLFAGQCAYSTAEECCNVRVETKTTDCKAPPAPVWGSWSNCQNSCKNRATDRCIETRKQVTDPRFAHCQELLVETRESELQPCWCASQPVVEKECIYGNDPTANCGMGHWHITTTHITRNCVTNEIIEQRVTGPDPMEPRQSCHLAHQPVLVDKRRYGCTSLAERCTGGNYMLQQCRECPPGTRPPYGIMEEDCDVPVPTGPCPGKSIAQTTEWTRLGECPVEGTCYTSGMYREEQRECVGGVFQDDCECLQFGRECCKKSHPTSRVSEDGRYEFRSFDCPVIITGKWVEVEDVNCQCGVCEVRRCWYDYCTGMTDCDCKNGRDGCKIVVERRGYIETVGEWSECQWSLEAGQDKCNTHGFRSRDRTVTCRNNLRVYEVTPETKSWTEVVVTEERSRVTQWSTQFFGELPLCILPASFDREQDECDYTDPCAPTQSIRTLRICEGRSTVVQTEPGVCEVDDTVITTAWSQCSVDCGLNAGTQSRHQYRMCSPTVAFNRETRACGCAMASWSEWTAPGGECDPCGDKEQIRTQTRTCIQPAGMPWGGSLIDECYGKCNACAPDAAGNMERRSIKYQADCLAQTHWDDPQCPVGNDLCRTRYVTRKEYWCGKATGKVEQITCPAPPAPPSPTITECSTLCGPGTQTITTYKTCDPTPIISTQACTGIYGNYQWGRVTAWSRCSATCGGGTRQRTSVEVCERNQTITKDTKIETQECNLQPCGGYWGVWSSWGMCSSTCGKGTWSRQRQCMGNVPGGLGCNATEIGYDEIFGRFTTSGSGAVHIRECDTGACCEMMEWSGWHNCCRNSNNGMKRLRVRGNKCNGKWETLSEDCGNSELRRIQNGDYVPRDCSSLSFVSTQYVDSTVTTQYRRGQIAYNAGVRKTTVYDNEGVGKTTFYDINYGRILNSGAYFISHCQCSYTLRVVGNEQKWFLVQNGQEIIQHVETHAYNMGNGQTLYYYRFGDQWYVYENNQFNPRSVNPPNYGITTNVITTPITQTDVAAETKLVVGNTAEGATKTVITTKQVRTTNTLQYAAPTCTDDCTAAVGSATNPTVVPAAPKVSDNRPMNVVVKPVASTQPANMWTDIWSYPSN